MIDCRKKQGFIHEKIIVIPKQIIDNMIMNPLISPLYITDIGYFPKAKNHYRERKDGEKNYILIFCVDGSGILEIENKTIKIQKNNLLIINSNTPHRYYSNYQNPWSIYWIHFNGSNAKYFTSLITINGILSFLSTDKHSILINQFNELYSILSNGYSTEHMIHVSCLLSVFLSNINYSSYDIVQKQTTDYINKSIKLMQKHINSQINLELISNKLNISKSYFIHIFKENTGFSPINYFIHLKMQKACGLLDTTNLTIKEIGNRLGYDDPYYFSRIFKKVNSLSPYNYRKIKKG